MQRSDEEKRSLDDLLAEVNDLTGDEREGSPPAAGRDSAPQTDERGRSDPAVGRGRRLPSLSRPRLGFSPRSFLAVLLLSVVAMFLGSAIPIVGVVGQFVGLFAAAFAVGLAGSRRRYLEVGLAGALAAALGFVALPLTSVLFPFAVRVLSEYGVAIAGVGAGAGLLASLLGHYFGRDLRDGLTRDV